MSCIFCQIANKGTESKIVFEDDELIAFHDINPQAPVHIQIIPKKHLESLNQVGEEDINLLGKIVYRAKLIAEEVNIARDGYRLIIQCGEHGGQVIPHLHCHILGGTQLRSTF